MPIHFAALAGYRNSPGNVRRKEQLMRLSFAKYLLTAAVPCLLCVTTSHAQEPQQMKMTTPIAPGVMVPDRVETSIGTLNLNYCSAVTVRPGQRLR
jgi:hypothetical protein